MGSQEFADWIVDPRDAAFAKGWLRSAEYVQSNTLASGNGTTGGEFFKVEGGTPLGRITATDRVRPAMVAIIDGAQVGVNEVTVEAGQTENFRVGDIVSVLDADGTTVVVSTRNITVVDPATPSLTLDGGTFTTENLGSIQGEDGSQDAIGFLVTSRQTAAGVDDEGAQLFSDQDAPTVVRGVVEEDQLTGSNSIIKADLEVNITFL